MQFVCSATDEIGVFYSLNSKPIPPLPPNVDIPAPTFIGGAVVITMSISNASANAVITCYAYLVNGTVLTRAAYLTVQGTGRCTHIHKYIESHIYQVLHLPPLISTLLHTMILPLYWSGDHPLMPSPHSSSPMLWWSGMEVEHQCIVRQWGSHSWLSPLQTHVAIMRQLLPQCVEVSQVLRPVLWS